MAILKCPQCGLNVSDKAAACPHCGLPIDKIIVAPNICSECGSTIPEGATICPSCGAPVELSLGASQGVHPTITQEPEKKNTQEPEKKNKKSTAITVLVLSVLFAVAVVVVVFFMTRTVTTLSGKYQITEDGFDMTITFNDDGTISGEGIYTLPMDFSDTEYLSWLGDLSTDINYTMNGDWVYSKNDNAFYVNLNLEYELLGTKASTPIMENQIVFCDKDGVISINDKNFSRSK